MAQSKPTPQQSEEIMSDMNTLTKRELFAALIMAGMRIDDRGEPLSALAEEAVRAARELLVALDDDQ